MKKFILSAVLLLLSIGVSSADRLYYDGVYYSILDDNTVKVVSSAAQYFGDIVIPATIEKNGVAYKVVEIADKAFMSCSKLTSVTIPNSVTTIGNYAFWECAGLTSVIIPNSVKTIGRNAFEYCSGISSVSIPNNVSVIEDYTFNGCNSLTEITLSESVNVLGVHAFANCKQLTDVYCYAKEEPRASDTAFYGSFTNYVTLHVPANSVSLYKAVSPWNTFKEIVALDSGSQDNPAGEKCATPTIEYKKGKLVFSCSTEGAICQSTISDVDVTSYNCNEIFLCATYNISVYATKSGMRKSDIANAKLCWIDVEPKTEGITNGVANVRAMAVMIQNIGGQLIINGIEDGTQVDVFSINGVQAGSAISHSGSAVINTNLPFGSVAILKIGDNSIKMVLK